MNTITPAEVARRLREVADLLEQTEPTPLTVHVAVDVSRYRTPLNEAARIAAVDAVASRFGLNAAPNKVASYWQHEAAQSDGGFFLSVSTEIEGPQVCACGVACTHGAGSGVAA